MSSLSQMMMMMTMMIVQTSSISKDYGVELAAKISIHSGTNNIDDDTNTKSIN